MPRIEIPVTNVTTGGVAAPAQVVGNATEKHFLKIGDGNVILEATNTGTSSARVVTIETPGQVDGIDVAELEVSVPKETVRYISLKAKAFRQKLGQVFINPAHAELKFRAYRI